MHHDRRRFRVNVYAWRPMRLSAARNACSVGDISRPICPISSMASSSSVNGFATSMGVSRPFSSCEAPHIHDEVYGRAFKHLGVVILASSILLWPFMLARRWRYLLYMALTSAAKRCDCLDAAALCMMAREEAAIVVKGLHRASHENNR